MSPAMHRCVVAIVNRAQITQAQLDRSLVQAGVPADAVASWTG